MIGEPCNNNKECGSKKSSSKDYCETIYGPSDADGREEELRFLTDYMSSKLKKGSKGILSYLSL
ncbi:hypothetical protein U3516DRAFT_746229 [Neocallimastix sp. 'constans']